ncbi:hypothetical protein KTF21_30185, partial [Burkholderia multivorans]|nr:hypothetical protein [Burkholderia multivorans]
MEYMTNLGAITIRCPHCGRPALSSGQCQLEGGAVEWRDEKEYLAVSRFPFSIRSHQLRGAMVLPLQP